MAVSPKIKPIATPATCDFNGTPASNIAKQQPHTVAIELLPQDSVINDSARIAYGKSSCDGIAGINALSAKLP